MAEAYKHAGVDVDAGYQAVERMKKYVDKTKRTGVIGALGGFGGLFDLSGLGYNEPVLVSGTDGVGTKLMIAFAAGQHDTIGIDAVAMCVNDIVAQGAEPLFFLDYIACGKLDPEKIEAIVKGVADGCQEAGCALIGGETAEMPDMYEADEYDLAGFAVGCAEKTALIDFRSVREGDVLIGLASNGLHSNGFSLARKIFFKDNRYSLSETYGLSRPLGEELLTPTRIYVKPVLAVLKEIDVHGIAHITGGGFFENIPRMFPDGLGAEIELGSWPVHDIFRLLQTTGTLTNDDMYGTFNMGIGLVLAVSKDDADKTLAMFANCGEKAYVIGRVVSGKGVALKGGETG